MIYSNNPHRTFQAFLQKHEISISLFVFVFVFVFGGFFLVFFVLGFFGFWFLNFRGIFTWLHT